MQDSTQYGWFVGTPADIVHNLLSISFPKHYPLSETNDFYGTNIALLGWFYHDMRPHPCIENFITFLNMTHLFSWLYTCECNL